MDGVQTQPVKAIFLEPVERILNEEVADSPTFWSIEIDGLAPRSGMPIGEELRGKIERSGRV